MSPMSWFKLEIVSVLAYFGILTYQVNTYGRVSQGFLLFAFIVFALALFLAIMFRAFPSLSDRLISDPEETGEYE
jgi:hypothetical protein